MNPRKDPRDSSGDEAGSGGGAERHSSRFARLRAILAMPRRSELEGDPWDLDASSAGTFWSDRGWWRRAASASVAVWASALLLFVGSVVAARFLGPSGFGSVVLATAVTTAVGKFLDLSLDQAVIHHGHRLMEARDMGGLKTMLRVSFSVDVLIGFAVFALVVALADPLASLVSGGELDPTLVRIAALALLFSTADGTTSAMLLLARRADLVGWLATATGLVRTIAIVGVVAAGGGTTAVVGAFAFAAAVGALLQAATAWRVTWREWRRADAAGGWRSWLRTLTSFGVYSTLTTSVLAANAALVPVMLGIVSGPTAVGIFRVAMLPVTVANLLTAPFRLVLLPEQARLSAQGDLDAVRTTMRATTKAALAGGPPMAAIGYFLLPWLIPLIYTDQFEPAVTAARILLIAGIVVLAGFGWTRHLASAIGRPEVTTMLFSGFLVLMLGGIAVLGRYGSTGAAIAVASAEVVHFIAAWIVLHRALASEAAKRGRPTPPRTQASADPVADR